MTEQTRKTLAQSLIELGTAANSRQSQQLRSSSFNEAEYEIVKSLGKFLKIGMRIQSSPFDHKFDNLIDAMAISPANRSRTAFEPDYAVPALKRVAEQLRLDNGETMDAKVSVLSRDPACYSLEHELFITESKLTDDSRPNLQDLMQSIHPSEVDWCPGDIKSDSSLQGAASNLWTLLIDDKSKCSCPRVRNKPYHLQEPLLGLSPFRDESGNITFDIFFNAACISEVEGTPLNCVHESSMTFKSGPLKKPMMKGLSTGSLCVELLKTHGKRLPLTIHMDPERNVGATMMVESAEDHTHFRDVANAFPLDDDERLEKMDYFHRIKLAADLSSSFYHFYGTRWMSSPWQCRQLRKVETSNSSATDDWEESSLLLSYQHEADPEPNDGVPPPTHREVLGKCWPQLLGFGLILLELMCNSAARRISREILTQGGAWETYRAARELRMTVEKDLDPVVNDCLESIFENRMFQDAVDDEELEKRRSIISEKVTAPMKRLLHMCTVKTQQHERPALSANSGGAPVTNLRIGGFIQRLPKPKSRSDLWKALEWVAKFVNINEHIIEKLHTVEAKPGSDTRWKPSRPIRIAILDSGYDPNSKFFKDQEQYGNHGIKERITWKDFVGDGPPEDKHESKHGTKVLCLMLMLLPKAEIFVGRIALDETYTKVKTAAGPLEKAIEHATRIWGVDVISISWGFNVRSDSKIEGAIKRASQYRDGRILFFASAGNGGPDEDERFPANYSEFVIPVRGTFANGTINSAYDPNVHPGSGDGEPRFATLATEVPYGELSPDNKKTLQVSGTSIAAPILAATAVTFLQFASFAAWYQPKFEKNLRRLFEKKGMISLFRKIGRDAVREKRLFVFPWELFNVQPWQEDWESLPAEMLKQWIRTMHTATSEV